MQSVLDPSASKRSLAERSRNALPVTDLIRRLDSDAISELMIYYRPLLQEIATRHGCRKLQRQYGVSDAIQNTWMSVSKNATKYRFENRRHFCSFLVSTLRNHIKSLRRALSTSKRDMTKEYQFDDGLTMESIPERCGMNQLERLAQKELACATLRALLRQPKEIQRLIRWRFRKGMTFAQIADRIDRKADEVRYLINTCLSEMSKDILIRDPVSG